MSLRMACLASYLSVSELRILTCVAPIRGIALAALKLISLFDCFLCSIESGAILLRLCYLGFLEDGEGWKAARSGRRREVEECY
jgi:hypothetical protein